MLLLLSNSMHRPQTHLYLVPMELCKWGEDVLWNLSPMNVRPSNCPAPFKYSSTTPGTILLVTPSSQKPWHIYWPGAKQILRGTPALRQEILPGQPSRMQMSCAWQPAAAKAKGIAHTLKEKQESPPQAPSLRSLCRQPSGTAHFSHNEL